MDTRRAGWQRAFVGILALTWAACSRAPAPTAIAPRVPDVQLVDAPDVVCGSATQIRVRVQTSENWPAESPATWRLTGAAGQLVGEGTWVLRDGTFIVAFPDGRPLPSGSYTLDLAWQEVDLGQLDLSVSPQSPAITDLAVRRVPDGEAVSRLDPNTELFYVGYAYEGGCLGAPYWVTVRDRAGATVCNTSGVLDTLGGTGAMACYLGDERLFEVGSYEAEMTLMGEVTRVLDFAIQLDPAAATPAPTRTPTPEIVSCEPLFTAAGVTSEGEPFLPLTLFDWYTQVVYAGSTCRNLVPGTVWRSAWWHEGALIREASGAWQGASEGVVWDSLTGQPDNPFLAPGAYTVTLEIAGTPFEAAFDVYAYETQEPTE